MTSVESVTITDKGGNRERSVTLMAEQVSRAVLRVPQEEEFGEGADFIGADGIRSFAAGLCHVDPSFEHLNMDNLAFLWKRRGGQRNGKGVYGKCLKPSGLLKHYSSVDFVIWLAADHCRDADYGPRELEALVFHELMHAGYDVDEKTGVREPALYPHDFEGFRAELDRYGFWDEDFRGLERTVRQLGLFDREPG